MEPSHGHAHGHVHGKAAENISAAFFLNAFFVVVEAVGGWATNSVAILSDALHDVGDRLSLATAWSPSTIEFERPGSPCDTDCDALG